MSLGPAESFNCWVALATKTLLCIAVHDASFAYDFEDIEIRRWKSNCDASRFPAGLLKTHFSS
jgi:hypothetical protein